MSKLSKKPPAGWLFALVIVGIEVIWVWLSGPNGQGHDTYKGDDEPGEDCQE